MSDVFTLAEILNAIETLKAANVPTTDGHYVMHVHPWTMAQWLIEEDARLTYADRCLALEWSRSVLRREGRHTKLAETPYEWICRRLGIEPTTQTDWNKIMTIESTHDHHALELK